MDAEIAVRAYVVAQESDRNRSRYGSQNIQNKFDRILVLDTETTTDRYQNLKFGSFKIYQHSQLVHQGIFYNPDTLNDRELGIINDYCRERELKPYTVREFVDDVFLPEVYDYGTLCVGFNVPFDLSRLAIDFGYARGSMKGGFSFKLTESKRYPRLLIKHIDSVKAFIRFGSSVNTYKRKLDFAGNFLDLRTLVHALTNEKHSLESACRLFNSPIKKVTMKTHDKITRKYVEYNLNDVDATYSLCLRLKEEYDVYGLDLAINRVYSSASIGKACLKAMGIKPFITKSKIPNEILGKVVASYFGGRSEVKIRKTPVLLDLLDFTSMYPTLCTLMDLWKLIICDHYEYSDCTDWIRKFVDNITLDDLRSVDTWKNLNVLVELEPHDDILSVRSKYGDKYTYNIAVNYLTTNSITLPYTLADVIGSKLGTGKTPKIVRATKFIPVGLQKGLQKSTVLGKEIDPSKDDFFKSLVEYRRELQLGRDDCKDEAQRTLLDKKQKAVKTIANATSYGIFMEINTTEEECDVIAYSLTKMRCHVSKKEEFGNLFNPLISTFITGAARLVLSIVETILSKHGAVHAYCDTDSMAIPPKYREEIQEFFRPLNPYSADVEMFKVDEYEDKNKKKFPLENVWFYGISAKRYCLYQIDEHSNVKIIKASSHGLGHLLNPFHRDNDENDSRWHERMWSDILNLHYARISVDELNEKYSNAFAISELSISTPTIMRRFDKLNRGRQYRDKIKPFNFCLVGFGNKFDDVSGKVIKPFSPYRRDTKEIPYDEFIDYHTRKTFRGEQHWKRFGDVFWEYTNHPESKFDGDIGLLRRKRVRVGSIVYVGKESNHLDLAEVLGVQEDDYAQYSNIDEIILSKRDVMLTVTCSDATPYGIMKEPLSNVKKALHSGDISKIKYKTKIKLLALLRNTK